MKIETHQAVINYTLTGQGPCLVLIHGFTDNLTMWYNQIPAFSKSHQVLAVDVRGHGETEVTDGPYSMDTFADDLNNTLEALKIEEACILGYSMGGRIALAFALKYPEKATGIVFANSGVMGPGAAPPPEQAAEMAERRQQMMDMMASGDVTEIADFMTERSLSPGFRDKAPDIFQKYKEVKMKNSAAAYQTIVEGMAAAMADPPDLSLLKCPALVIAGEKDGFMPLDTAHYMERTIKDATLSVFPTGHAAAIEVPDAFNRAVLQFLEKYINECMSGDI